MDFASKQISHHKYQLKHCGVRKCYLNVELIDNQSKDVYRAYIDQKSISSNKLFTSQQLSLQKLAQEMPQQPQRFNLSCNGAVTYAIYRHGRLAGLLELNTIKTTDQDQIHEINKIIAQMKIEELQREKSLKEQINKFSSEYVTQLNDLKKVIIAQNQAFITFKKQVHKRFQSIDYQSSKESIQMPSACQISSLSTPLHQNLLNSSSIFSQHQQSNSIQKLSQEVASQGQKLSAYCQKLQKLEQELQQTTRLLILLDRQRQVLASHKNTLDSLSLQYSNQVKQLECVKRATRKSCQFLNANHPWNAERDNFYIKHSLLMSEIKKIEHYRNSGWATYIKNVQIPINTTSKFSIRQTKTKSSNILTGISSLTDLAFKGVQQKQQKEDIIVYSSHTGNVCINNDVKRGGRKVKDGQIIDVYVDCEVWEVQWRIGHELLTIAAIPEKMRAKDLFLIIKMRDSEDTVQLLLS